MAANDAERCPAAKDVYKGKPTKFAGGLTLNKKKKK